MKARIFRSVDNKLMDSESETLECFYFETGLGSGVYMFVS